MDTERGRVRSNALPGPFRRHCGIPHTLRRGTDRGQLETIGLSYRVFLRKPARPRQPWTRPPGRTTPDDETRRASSSRSAPVCAVSERLYLGILASNRRFTRMTTSRMSPAAAVAS